MVLDINNVQSWQLERLAATFFFLSRHSDLCEVPVHHGICITITNLMHAWYRLSFGPFSSCNVDNDVLSGLTQVLIFV